MIELPVELQSELTRMRRDASKFSIVSILGCKFCTEKETAFVLTHPVHKEAGTWCATHGWLSFPSSYLPVEWEKDIRGR